LFKRLAIAVALVALLATAACGSTSDDERPLRVAFIRPVPSADGNEPFDQELRAEGLVRGRNLVYVQAEPELEVLISDDEIRSAVEGWVQDGIDLIVAFSSAGAEIAATTASETPVLFLVNDPVAVGLVTDPARPDRNLTGVTFRIPADRTLDLARQAIPDLTTIGILEPSSDPAGPPARAAMLAAARAAGLMSVTEAFRDEADIGRAVTALLDRGADAVAVVNAPTSIRFISVIEPTATALGLPIVANTSLATGALVVLEPNVNDLLARLGRQAARLLGGATTAEVPVENPTEFRVVLNATVATELGLPALPADLIRQADVVR